MSVSMNPNYSAISSHSAGKIYVPVNASNLIYSNFNHISGYKAKHGENGVSISKIQILNTLIDHLSSIKGGSQKSIVKGTTPEQIDSMIDNFQTQIRQAVKQAEISPYAIAGARPEIGALFTINA